MKYPVVSVSFDQADLDAVDLLTDFNGSNRSLEVRRLLRLAFRLPQVQADLEAARAERKAVTP